VDFLWVSGGHFSLSPHRLIFHSVQLGGHREGGEEGGGLDEGGGIENLGRSLLGRGQVEGEIQGGREITLVGCSKTGWRPSPLLG